MQIITTAEQADSITALDLKAAALEAIAQGDEPGYLRNSSVQNPNYAYEILVVGTRAGVATNANAEWGDVRQVGPGVDGKLHQVVVLDDTGETYRIS
jgi:hypothetical protein